ncbi:CAP domain-containing protein [Phormidium tenue FACHB-886]|nr:CAP domain-containing protein [Phormidium tenue FACHB-886]
MRSLTAPTHWRVKWNQPLKQCAIAVIVASALSGCTLSSRFFPSLTLPNNRTVQSSPQTPAQSETTSQMEAQVEQQINKIRTQQGLEPLRHNAKLADVARTYSQRMADENFFGHTSPTGDTMVERVRSTGIIYFNLGENLFKGTNSPRPVPAAVQGWMNSAGHRENILRSKYEQTGVGIWRKGNTYYFTQLFMRSPNPLPFSTED